jgi:Ca-activated chloride channel family protein
MSSKFVRARKALTEFLRTSNPQDEFFVVGFNDRPAIIVDYTSDVDDVEARMVMLKPENRTALIDAVYLGVDHLKQAKYDRKALLIISDGGDNRSRYTEGELRARCARARCRSTPSASSTPTRPPRRSRTGRSC